MDGSFQLNWFFSSCLKIFQLHQTFQSQFYSSNVSNYTHISVTRISWARFPEWPILLSFTVDYYGVCTCGTGAEFVNGVCQCSDDLIVHASGAGCYDGVDTAFYQTQFTCETDETDALLDMLDYNFGLTHSDRFGIDCDTFGYPVIEAKYVATIQGTDSGIQPAFTPTLWENKPVSSATIRKSFVIWINSFDE